MKNFISILIFITCFNGVYTQSTNIKIVKDSIYSETLRNKAGNSLKRSVTVYLPPGYENSEKNYPVIYFLHGFLVNDHINSMWFNTAKKLEYAFNKEKIRPFIMVIVDQYTLFRGSFYTNSSLTGNWEDFTTKDLASYMDKNYRTIPDRNSRGIAGWSMGGFGAIKLGMKHPDIFGTVYALSPATLDLVRELGIHGEGYKQVNNIENRELLIDGYNYMYPNIIVAMGRAFTPNMDNPPFYADLPYTLENKTVKIHPEIISEWKKNMPIYMIENNIENLKSLNAIKLDWGRNDFHKHIPESSKAFSMKLEQYGIDHYAEEYIGDHGNKLWTLDGRVINDMLPFFDQFLTFESDKL
ncbi:alpha/beta hydrolase-fold protein [Mangrovivirga sp. M17]|uniref:Alpha/beta hydrolase-fold protein n=1 Tax=Mangrovivirga halotolerans TaxID=2993936 RepID=A0ABT3RV13_9BACT|nr:alpha/beta hydrolase-fold protein [Mangrovivirga halotolerans]MCX2745356.1 alpha/beta hydrolase-fold protein [Mangrovivirga halotolerans]